MDLVMTNNAERVWRGLLPEFDGAAQSIIEALMYSLRERGIAALEETNVRRRLGDLSARQLRQVNERLEKLRPRYSKITDELISTLLEQLK